jgi:hypothetical protein
MFSDDWESRLAEYRETKKWDEAENDEHFIIRREAFSNTKNWAKAKKNADPAIVIDALIATGDWMNFTRHKSRWVRLIAYCMTRLWNQAITDSDPTIVLLAATHLGRPDIILKVCNEKKYQ